MRFLSWLGLLILASLVCLSDSQVTTTPYTSTPSTSSPAPCWSEAFPNITTRAKNPVTCDICTEIFQGLDDFLLENEDQVIFILTGLLLLFFSLSDCPCPGKSLWRFPLVIWGEKFVSSVWHYNYFIRLIITQICWRLVEACMDDLIEMIIESGLNPKDMCEALLLCP